MTVDSKYLQKGKQTQITDVVIEHAKKSSNIEINEGKDAHPNLQKAYKVSKYLYQLKNVKGYIDSPRNLEEAQRNYKIKDDLFRKRTADEILREGIYPTCSDEGIVFRALMIALEVPTAYVETFHEDYLFGRKFHGHVIGKVQAGDKWYFIDPKNNEKRVSETEEELYPLIIFREGLDSWDIGIHGYDDMHKKKMENLEDLLNKYKKLTKSIYKSKLDLADKVLQNPELSQMKR